MTSLFTSLCSPNVKGVLPPEPLLEPMYDNNCDDVIGGSRIVVGASVAVVMVVVVAVVVVVVVVDVVSHGNSGDDNGEHLVGLCGGRTQCGSANNIISKKVALCGTAWQRLKYVAWLLKAAHFSK